MNEDFCRCGHVVPTTDTIRNDKGCMFWQPTKTGLDFTLVYLTTKTLSSRTEHDSLYGRRKYSHFYQITTKDRPWLHNIQLSLLENPLQWVKSKVIIRRNSHTL